MNHINIGRGFLPIVLSVLFSCVLSAQDKVVIDRDNPYFIDFDTGTDGWAHARADYGSGGWNSSGGYFQMTCISVDGNGLGNIVQRPYIYLGEEGEYTISFRIKTVEPVTDFRLTLGDYTGIHRNFVHDFSLIEAHGQWKEYSITFTSSQSGNGYDEGDGSGPPEKGVWVAFRTKQPGTYYIDYIRISYGSIPVEGSVFFVAMDGDDSNPGTKDLPFATIQKAATMLTAGDTCYIRGGSYREEVVATGLRGTQSAPIVFTNYGSEKVVMDGTVSIDSIQTSEWTLYKNGIYKTSLSADIWQLFVDDEMMMAGRWPNASFEDNSVWDREAWAHGSTASEYQTMATLTGSGLPDLAATGLDFTGAMAVLNIGKFTTWCQPVTSHSAGSGSFNYGPIPEVSGSRFWDDGYWELTQRYYLEAHLNCVDVEGEWYYNKDTKDLYFLTPGGGVPSGDIRGKVRTYGFDLSSINYVHVVGIDFFGCTLHFNNATNSRVEDCRFRYFYSPKRMLGETSGWEPQTGVVIRGPKFGSGSHNIIRNCELAYCDGMAMYIEGRFDLVENILGHDLDWSGIGSPTFHFRRADDIIVRRSTIYNTGASACFNMGARSVAELIKIGPRVGGLQDDGATIQFRPNRMDGSVARYNWSHNHQKFGIRSDINGQAPNDPAANGFNWTAHHNVVWQITRGTTNKPGIMVEGNYNKIYHNLSFSNEPRDICLPVHNGWANQHTITRNNLTDPDGIGINRTGGDSPPGFADHNIEMNVKEQIMDFENRDFRPRAGSPVIDAGVLIEGINDNYVGDAPDIGAYEKGGEYWVPGFQLKKCSQPSPKNRAENAFTDAGLIWLKGYGSSFTNIYFGTDSLSVAAATPSSPEFKSKLDVNLFEPGKLVMGQTYFWRADAVSNDTTIKGDVWNFKVTREFKATSAESNKVIYNSFVVFPNPVTDKLTIRNKDISQEPMIITVFDQFGRVLLNKETKSTQEIVNMKNWINGLYYVRIQVGNKITHEKIIKF